MTPQGLERKRRVCQKLWHEETTTVLQLSIYMGVLAILKEYVMVFQGSQTLVHKLQDRQLELFLAYLACFVKAEHIIKLSPRALKELVLEDYMLLASKEIYVGQEADMYRSQNPKHPVSTLHHLLDLFSQLFLRLRIMLGKVETCSNSAKAGHGDTGSPGKKKEKMITTPCKLFVCL
ncbi:uncharacterized protein [Misgurnus anguillicaudatus]|uniref:uncharacterized protein isoform X1 n=1 Tax=Misgurnus anguillicaudatus TaxID=75329 RepID=UPI003CCFC1A6